MNIAEARRREAGTVRGEVGVGAWTSASDVIFRIMHVIVIRSTPLNMDNADRVTRN
jgi:hypothetical protein